jgi:hypothetical protein
MAAWLRTTPQDTVFSIADAGLVPTSAGGRTAIDSLFLNEALLQVRGRMTSEELAAEVLRRRPDVMIMSSANPNAFAGLTGSDQLLYDRAAGEGYRLAFVSTGNLPSCAYSLWAFQR